MLILLPWKLYCVPQKRVDPIYSRIAATLGVRTLHYVLHFAERLNLLKTSISSGGTKLLRPLFLKSKQVHVDSP